MSASLPKRRPLDRDETPAPGDGATRVRLRFLPDGAEVRVPSGTPIFDAASWNGIAIDSTCGGHGTCKKCKVRIVSGEVPIGAIDPRAFGPEELREGWRLACRAGARGDLVVEVPPLETRPKAALVGVGRHVILRPSVQKRHLILEEPTLEDQRPDLQRVLDGLDDLEPYASVEMLRELGGTLRRSHFDVTAVVCDEELIALEPGDTSARRFAIAFDLGTTTVVATLLDLESGQPAAVASMLNRQQPYGADVITRISATMMDDTALGELRQRAHETMASLSAEVCAEAGVQAGEVYEITVCGNVTMMQLALGIDPEPLSMAPFVVATHTFPPVRASEFGVELHPRAPAFVFPSLGAYVGGDIVAGILATGLTRDRRLRLFIDVGTNSEIALGSVDRVLATAAPAGPAFEAAQIRCGMRAAEGAIEGVQIDAEADSLALEVIGDVEAIGMCGSGLVDAVAELVRSGLLDNSGRFIPDEDAAALHPALATRLTKIGEERVFVLQSRGEDPASSVYLSQRDVRELQFAKASIATGWQILLRELGVEASEISQVLLAGSFGSYLTPLSAVRIGLVPDLALPRIISAGNVAGEGAKIVALSLRERAEAESILREVEYVELSGRADFNDLFIDQLAFPVPR
ncbi:MAG TPA: ASKHA domain-containing protein [Solirubrobacteraceae bacterium]